MSPPPAKIQPKMKIGSTFSKLVFFGLGIGISYYYADELNYARMQSLSEVKQQL